MDFLKLVVATQNPGKIREIREILKGLNYVVIPISELYPDFEVEEDGQTYAENASKKAIAAARLTGLMALADDSGLEVKALGGAPGLFSARFGGKSLPQSEKNRLILESLKGVSDRSARFVCVVAVATPEGQVKTAEGICEGSIGFKEQGDGGFGYDPIFIVEGYQKTMAELEPEIKNKISHRARALKKIREILSSLQSTF
ncbi:MAG TPA: XTP/dITP diphosphatase [Candidatus Limnocylindrales bacterium]|nr:XTP/dITP diphosphatase [Candidatus Limnocylindrales bacterium]